MHGKSFSPSEWATTRSKYDELLMRKLAAAAEEDAAHDGVCALEVKVTVRELVKQLRLAQNQQQKLSDIIKPAK